MTEPFTCSQSPLSSNAVRPADCWRLNVQRVAKTISLAGFVLCCFALSLPIYGQGVGTSGSIRGTAKDTSGAVVPNVKITVADSQTGLNRTVTSDGAGEYRVTGLPPGTYDVTAASAGFATAINKGVVVGIGETLDDDFQLHIASGNTEIVVNSEVPVIETDRGSQSDTISSKLIEDLPISRRDYLSFALLVPGVSNSNVIAGDNDYRVQQTPQSGLSFYGSNGRGNSVTVDGGEANDDAGGVRLTLSQDAVDQFQINRSNYPAELGGASGGAINIVTKSGTNTIHGGLFGFFRNSALDAQDPFAFTSALQPGQPFSLSAQGHPVKDSLSRQQFGGTLGLPIRKDKTFLFAAFEGLRQDAQNSVPLLTNSSIFAPTAVQNPIIGGLAARGGAPVPCISPSPGSPLLVLPAAACAFALESILTVDPTSRGNPFVSPAAAASKGFVVNQFEANGGLFPFGTRQYEGSARLDHRFGQNDTGLLRYSAAHRTESDPTVQSLTGFSRGTSTLATDSTLQGSYFHQFSANLSNEAILQFNDTEFDVTTNDPGGPGLDVAGYGFFGRNIFLPSFNTSRRYQISDNFSALKGNHNLRFGFSELIRSDNNSSSTFLGGRFEFLQLPGGLLSPCLQVPVACGLAPSIASAPLTTLQSFSLGLPAFYEQGFGTPAFILNRPLTSVYAQDAWQIRPGLTLNYGLRYEIDGQDGVFNTYKKDFAPRVSFAYTPGRDQKTVVRGAYGIFYAQVYGQIPSVVKTLGNNNGTRQIANSLVSILGVPGAPQLNSAAIYQTLLGQGRIECGTPRPGQSGCIAPSDLAQFGLNIANTGPLPPGTVIFSAQPNYRPPQAQQASFGIERQFGRATSISIDYIYVRTTHLPIAIDTNLLPGAPIVTGAGADGLPTNGLPFRNFGAPQCQATPSLCFADPTHTILQNNQYRSAANSSYNGGIIDFKRRFSQSFTLLANYTYSKAIDESTDFNSDFAPFDQTNIRAERALSEFDQRHKVVIAGVLDSPFTRSRYLGGFELSPIFTYNSGHPFNLLAGSDINGDGHFTNDRPPGAGRNTGLGPDYINLDARLSRAINLRHERSLIFTAESFDVTNHTNYASVNNLVGANFRPPFNVHGSAALSPSQPLGFTAANAKRQIQLGARLAF